MEFCKFYFLLISIDVILSIFRILPSFYGSLTLLHKSTINGHTSNDHVVVSVVYGASLVLLFSVSFLYHCVFYLNNNLTLKDLLHRMDRAMIYIFIAGSYFPWLLLEHFKFTFIVSVLKYLIWILASLGIIYQQVC
jgi:monocyte-to-macrophage differentiation protein